MTQRPQDDRNQEATVYLVCASRSAVETTPTLSRFCQGNLDERVTDAIVWELMLQAGPVGVSQTVQIRSVATHSVPSKCSLA